METRSGRQWYLFTPDHRTIDAAGTADSRRDQSCMVDGRQPDGVGPPFHQSQAFTWPYALFVHYDPVLGDWRSGSPDVDRPQRVARRPLARFLRTRPGRSSKPGCDADRKFPEMKKPLLRGAFGDKPGDFLLSHTLARAVPSGLRSLTTVFGMGTGGSSSLRSPRKRETQNILTVRPLQGGGFGKQRSPRPRPRVVYAVEIMVKPNGQLVTVSSARCHTYTSVLSNWSSSSALLSY